MTKADYRAKSLLPINMKTKSIRSVHVELRGIAILSCAIILAVALPPQIRKFNVSVEPILLEQIIEVDTCNDETNKGLPLRSSAPATSSNQFVHQKPGSAVKQPVKLDVNTADATAFARLQGIGPILSNRIVKFRDALGGFYDISQVSETYGLDTLVYLQLRDKLELSEKHKCIALDTASFKTLLRHPYLEYEHVRLIKSHTFIPGLPVAEQLSAAGLPGKISSKVSPYLRMTSVIDRTQNR
jgi:DNA uptake protein ComE-like DNA-binding protein